MSNRLIVESKNDKYFIQALVKYLNISNLEISEINITEFDYLTLEGLSISSLERELKTIEADAQKSSIKKIGIILDADNSQTTNLAFINKAIIKIFSQNQQKQIEEVSKFISINSPTIGDIQIACYFININGNGELETLLKVIKSQDSSYADCLEAWQDCLKANDKEIITKKEFDKFWVSNYLRFDTCSKQDKQQSQKKCSVSGFEYIMHNKQNIWDFEHTALDQLKKFLKLFN